MTILLTGATGRIGSMVAQQLCQQFQCRPRLLVRNPSKVRDTLAAQCDIVQGDLGQPASLVAATRDITAALVVSPVDPNQHLLQSNLVSAIKAQASSANAVAQQTPLIVKVSGLGTALDSTVDSGRWHAQTEAYIQQTNLPFTFLRPLYFMQNLGFQLPAIKKSGLLLGAVGDTPIAMVHAADIASCAAHLLAQASAKPGQALTLTGPDALTYTDIAQTMAAVLQRPVKYQRQTLEELQRSLAQQDQPAWHQALILQFSKAFADGWADRTTNSVQDITGVAPRTLRQYLVEDGVTPIAGEHNPFPS